jgi:hypothetical protein
LRCTTTTTTTSSLLLHISDIAASRLHDTNVESILQYLPVNAVTGI